MRPRDPVGCGLRLLVAAAVVAILVPTGFLGKTPDRVEDLVVHGTVFGISVTVWSYLLVSVALWATTALAEGGWGRFPPHRLELAAGAVVAGGAAMLLLAFGWILLGGPGPAPSPSFLGAAAPDGPVMEGMHALAAGALAALEGLAAAAWFLLLDAVRRSRHERPEEPGKRSRGRSRSP